MASITRCTLDAMLRRRLMMGWLPAKQRISAFSSSSVLTNGTLSTGWKSNSCSLLTPGNLSIGLQSPYMKLDSTSAAVRWKHAGKMGNHLETLDEMAHRPEREAAQERRKKKKDRKAKKKGQNKTASAEVDSAQISDDLDNDNDNDDFLYDDLDEDEAGNNEGEEEPTLPDPIDVEAKMMSVVARFEESLKSIRGAEPSPEMFDDIQVNAYGSMTPLKAVGQVVIVSPTLAQITCFDPSVAKDVQKAVQLALELNPQTEEGGMVRVPLPKISMDVRQQTAKQLKKKAESCRQRIRQLRRKAMDVVKKGKDGKLPGISKDDAFSSSKEIESVVEKVNKKLQEIVDKKMDSIMAV